VEIRQHLSVHATLTKQWYKI